MRFQWPVGVMLLGALAGCGASHPAGKSAGRSAVAASPSSTFTAIQKVDAAFLAKAADVCATLVAEDKAHPFPLRSFDPTAPTPAQLRVVGHYFTTFVWFPATVAKLDALGEPAQDPSGWDRYRSLVHQTLAISQQQAAAATKADVNAWQLTLDNSRTTSDALEGFGPLIGISKSSPCGNAF